MSKNASENFEHYEQYLIKQIRKSLWVGGILFGPFSAAMVIGALIRGEDTLSDLLFILLFLSFMVLAFFFMIPGSDCIIHFVKYVMVLRYGERRYLPETGSNAIVLRPSHNKKIAAKIVIVYDDDSITTAYNVREEEFGKKGTQFVCETAVVFSNDTMHTYHYDKDAISPPKYFHATIDYDY